MKKEHVTAIDLLEVLKKALWRSDAHAWLYEVGNATGFAVNRHADALVVSCWPSRGLWLGGIETKVSRTDWLKELKDPAKSSEIQAYCHYWWLVTTPDIVREGELPKTWGHIEVDGKQHKIVQQAPELKPKPLTIEFVAAVLRNQAKTVDALVDVKSQEKVRKKVDDLNEQIQGYLTKIRELQPNSELKEQYEALRDNVQKFAEATGIDLDDSRRGDSVAVNIRLVEIVRKLNGYGGCSSIRKNLKEVDEQLAELDVGEIVHQRSNNVSWSTNAKAKRASR